MPAPLDAGMSRIRFTNAAPYALKFNFENTDYTVGKKQVRTRNSNVKLLSPDTTHACRWFFQTISYNGVIMKNVYLLKYIITLLAAIYCDR